MMEKIDGFKATMATAFGLLTALWGWFGWFVVAWILLMVLDYLTGTWAAKKSGTWASSVAREGLSHKGTEIVMVLVAGVLDLVIGLILTNLPVVKLPFEYTVLAAPLVVAWYILTEMGSILENSGKLGGPQPKWFKKAICALKGSVDDAGEMLTGEKDGKKE